MGSSSVTQVLDPQARGPEADPQHPGKNATCVIFNPRAGEETGGSLGVLVSSRAMRHYSQRRKTMFPVTLRAVLCPCSLEHTQNMSTHRFEKNHFDITHKILQLYRYKTVYDVLSILAKIIMKNVFLLNIYLFLSVVYESFACICVCTSHVRLVL